MNILTDCLPTAVEVDGEIYEIESDFRICLSVILACEDPELTDREKVAVMLELLYKETLPANLQEAYRLGVKFLDCGDDQEGAGNGDTVGRLYSFDKDAKYIYSAIKQSHGIDLDEVDYLHWWKFCYMFLDLKEDCFFNRLIHLRRQKKLGKLTKEEWELYYKIQDIVDLPEFRSVEEQQVASEFMQLLNGGDPH